MDKQLLKITIGLALQSAIMNRTQLETLLALYAEPNVDKAKNLHEELILSRNHHDREIAILLEPILELGPPKGDPKGLATEMKEMEFLLYRMLSEPIPTGPEINDWMNYITNAAESLTDGFWIDAKILLSQALEISQSAAVEQLKNITHLTYELNILQRATSDYFDEIKTYPLKLILPEGRLGVILKVQEIMVDLMQLPYQSEREKRDGIIQVIVGQLNAALRSIMNENKEIDAAKRELRLLLEHLNESKNQVACAEERTLISRCSERLKELLETELSR